MTREERIRERNDLTSGAIWKKLLVYWLPIAAGTIFQQLYNAVDGIVVGKFVGTEALAAVGGSSTYISSLIINFFVALSGGASVIIAQYFGARDNEAVSRATHTAVAFSVISGLAITAIGVVFSPTFLAWMNTPAETVGDAALYLRTVFFGAVFTLLYNMGAGVLRAVGDSRRPFLYLMLCCLLNIVLDLLFVIGFRLGVRGVAIATVVSQAVSAVLVLARLAKADGPYRLFLNRVRLHVPSLVRVLKIGLPLGCQSLMYSMTNTLIQVGINSLGTLVVASWSLSGKLDGFYWGVVNAAGVALCNFIGQNYGAGQNERVARSVRVGFLLYEAMTAIMVGLLMGFGHQLLPLFTDDPAVVEQTWLVMTYFVPYYFLWTVIEVFSGALRGKGNTTVPFILTALGVCVIRIIWIYIVFPSNPSVRLMSYCYPVSWALTAAAMVIYYFHTVRKGKTIKP
jgi:putative MATE family efflux protein